MKKLITLVFLVGCSFIEPQDPFDKPYSVRILNDHAVQLTNKKDTVLLLLENAYALADETIIYIKQ